MSFIFPSYFLHASCIFLYSSFISFIFRLHFLYHSFIPSYFLHFPLYFIYSSFTFPSYFLYIPVNWAWPAKTFHLLLLCANHGNRLGEKHKKFSKLFKLSLIIFVQDSRIVKFSLQKSILFAKKFFFAQKISFRPILTKNKKFISNQRYCILDPSRPILNFKASTNDLNTV